MKSDRGHQTLKIALSKSVCVYSYLIFVGKYDSLPFVLILPKRHIHNTFHSIIQKFKNTGSIYVKSTKSKSNQNKKSNGNYQWNSSYVTKKNKEKNDRNTKNPGAIFMKLWLQSAPRWTPIITMDRIVGRCRWPDVVCSRCVMVIVDLNA